MKLLNHTLWYTSIAFFVVIGIWATFLYVNLLDEIYDSIDDGLENSKILIIQQAQTDSTIVHKTNFRESNYAIHQIPAERALRFRDIYIDSTLYMVNEEDYEPVRILKTAFAANGKYYQLDVVSSMVEEDDLIEDIFYSILWLYVILLISILLINNIVLERIWRPFHAILERLKRFNIQSPDNAPEVRTKVREFRMLNESVNSLLDRSVTIFNSQKQFIENASHELQTPLAISINKLELLAEKESMGEAELKEISSVIQSLERLTHLNKTLLLLSRIENRQFQENVMVNFGEVVDRAVSDLSDLADYKSVKVTVEHTSTLLWRMDQQLAAIMISNLLKNAIIHNIAGGSVGIVIKADALVLTNTGHPQALDPDRIFKRFYKKSGSPASTGLGLAIVKSIADYYGMSIRYQFNGQHSFTITNAAASTGGN